MNVQLKKICLTLVLLAFLMPVHAKEQESITRNITNWMDRQLVPFKKKAKSFKSLQTEVQVIRRYMRYQPLYALGAGFVGGLTVLLGLWIVENEKKLKTQLKFWK